MNESINERSKRWIDSWAKTDGVLTSIGWYNAGVTSSRESFRGRRNFIDPFCELFQRETGFLTAIVGILINMSYFETPLGKCTRSNQQEFDINRNKNTRSNDRLSKSSAQDDDIKLGVLHREHVPQSNYLDSGLVCTRALCSTAIISSTVLTYLLDHYLLSIHPRYCMYLYIPRRCGMILAKLSHVTNLPTPYVCKNFLSISSQAQWPKPRKKRWPRPLQPKLCLVPYLRRRKKYLLRPRSRLLSVHAQNSIISFH